MKIIFFGLTPLSFDGGFEKNISRLALYFLKNTDARIVTGSHSLISWLYSLLHGHRLEERLQIGDIDKKISEKYYQIKIKDIFPFHSSFYAVRKEFRSADIVYVKNEIPDILLVKYFTLFEKKPVLIVGIHTPLKYKVTKSIVSRMHNLFYKSYIYKLVISDCKIRALNYSDYIFSKNVLMIKDENIRLIPNGVNVNKFCCGLRENDKNNENYFKILFAGRMTEQKGVDILEKAIIELRADADFNKMIFVFAGSGELEKIPVSLADKFENVKYLGHVENMVSLYQSVDIVVAPSRWEGLPNNVLEAQSCGIPVIVSDTPGSNDVIINNKTGLVISCESDFELKNAIIKMFHMRNNNPDLFKDMRNGARVNILENFSIEVSNQKIGKFFNDCLE